MLLASSVVLPSIAQAESFQGLGFLPGTDSGVTTGLSADGKVVIGAEFNSGSNAYQYSFVWSNGTLNQITGVGSLVQATGVNADGSVVVGYSFGAFATGWVWRPSTGAVTFAPPFHFNYAGPSGISADGSVIVGTASGNLPDQAFRWTQAGGTVLLGTLPTDVYSGASAVSGDGMVVVGGSSSAGFQRSRAFRWSPTNGMVDIGGLPGASLTTPTAVNFNGSVIVGYSITTAAHAFRWQDSTGVTALPELPASQSSEAYGINHDGSVIVGASGGQAAVWNKNGVQNIQNLLAASGVNLAGWSLAEARGVSADGTIVAGTGLNPSGQGEPWIARIAGSAGLGLITPITIQQSFSGQSAVGETGNAALAGTFATITNYATQAQGSEGKGSSPYQAFAYGGYDSDPAGSGTLGFARDLPDAALVGATVSANYIKTAMVFDGSAKFDAGSVGAFGARIPQSGLQWLLGLGALTGAGDIRRGYLNGSGPAFSVGHTTANGYGAIARLGWTFDRLFQKTQITPFVSYSVTTLRTSGYTELDGPFPAQFNSFTDTAQVSRLGADVRYTFVPGQWIWVTADWAHRFGGGTGATIAGSLIGFFGLTTPGVAVMQDWAEVTAGFRLPISADVALSASVTASVAAHSAITSRTLLGFTARF